MEEGSSVANVPWLGGAERAQSYVQSFKVDSGMPLSCVATVLDFRCLNSKTCPSDGVLPWQSKHLEVAVKGSIGMKRFPSVPLLCYFFGPKQADEVRLTGSNDNPRFCSRDRNLG